MELAQAYFPPGGSAEGAPSYELFDGGPLDAARELCARRFDELPEVAAGIRALVTVSTPFFPAMTFFAVLVSESGTELVELVSLTVDEDYWDTIGDDPDG